MNDRRRYQNGNIGIIVAAIGILVGLVLIVLGSLSWFGKGDGGGKGPGSPSPGGDYSPMPLPPTGPTTESRPVPRQDQVIVDLSELPPKVIPGHLGFPQSLTRDSVQQWMSGLPTSVKEVRLIIGGKTRRADITYFEEGEKETGINVIR